MDHDAKIVAIFLESEVICKFVVPKYILIDNGIEQFIEFDQLRKNYDIAHQYTTLHWPSSNGMVERLIKRLNMIL